MTIYIHIGYPKCFSTTLQRGYFEKHPSIHFGGVGVGDNISYASKTIELCFESLLKYANKAYWERHKQRVRTDLLHFVKEAKDKKVVFSSEHLSMNFSLQGIDNCLKYSRLKYLFKEFNIKVLLIRRDPIALLRSLYGEYVRMGYSQEYAEFLKWVIVFQDRNFLSDFNFELKNNQLCNFFGSDNVDWLEFEVIKKDGVEETLNKKLSRWLNIEYELIPIDNRNPSLSTQEIALLLELNKKQPRGLSLAQTEPFERHRSRLLYKNSNLRFSEEEIFSNVLAKRNALKKIKQINRNKREDFDKASELEKRIFEVIDSYVL